MKSSQSEGGAKANAKGVVQKIKHGKFMKELGREAKLDIHRRRWAIFVLGPPEKSDDHHRHRGRSVKLCNLW